MKIKGKLMKLLIFLCLFCFLIRPIETGYELMPPLRRPEKPSYFFGLDFDWIALAVIQKWILDSLVSAEASFFVIVFSCKQCEGFANNLVSLFFAF